MRVPFFSSHAFFSKMFQSKLELAPGQRQKFTLMRCSRRASLYTAAVLLLASWDPMIWGR